MQIRDQMHKSEHYKPTFVIQTQNKVLFFNSHGTLQCSLMKVLSLLTSYWFIANKNTFFSIWTGITQYPTISCSFVLLSGVVASLTDPLVFIKIGPLVNCHPNQLHFVGKRSPVQTQLVEMCGQNVNTWHDALWMFNFKKKMAVFA